MLHGGAAQSHRRLTAGCVWNRLPWDMAKVEAQSERSKRGHRRERTVASSDQA